jgi:hypothetical protein
MFIYLTHTKVWHVCQTNMIEIVLPWQGPSQNHIFSNHPYWVKIDLWLGVFFSSFSRSTCLVGFLCAFWMVEVTHIHTHTQIGVELDRPLFVLVTQLPFQFKHFVTTNLRAKRWWPLKFKADPICAFSPIVVSKGPCWSHTLGIDRSRKLQQDWFLWVKHLVTSASEFGSVGGVYHW